MVAAFCASGQGTCEQNCHLAQIVRRVSPILGGVYQRARRDPRSAAAKGCRVLGYGTAGVRATQQEKRQDRAGFVLNKRKRLAHYTQAFVLFGSLERTRTSDLVINSHASGLIPGRAVVHWSQQRRGLAGDLLSPGETSGLPGFTGYLLQIRYKGRYEPRSAPTRSTAAASRSSRAA